MSTYLVQQFAPVAPEGVWDTLGEYTDFGQAVVNTVYWSGIYRTVRLTDGETVWLQVDEDQKIITNNLRRVV